MIDKAICLGVFTFLNMNIAGMLAQTNGAVVNDGMGIIGLVIQGGFAGLCGFLIWRMDRRQKEQDRDRKERDKVNDEIFEKKDAYTRQLVENQRQMFMAVMNRDFRLAEELSKRPCIGPAAHKMVSQQTEGKPQ